jgi:molecular chaperone Hsp33
MLRSLGRDEVESIIAEQGQVEVTCEFCGAVQQFDPVDAAQVFLDAEKQQPAPPDVH